MRKSVAAALLLLACGPASGQAWSASFNAARRAYSAGRYEEAARLFGVAEREALRVKDRDEALFMQARTHTRHGRAVEARASYERLLLVSPDGLRAARARAELGRLWIKVGDERGFALLAETVLRHPNDGAASSALLELVRHWRETGGEEAVRAKLEPWIGMLAGSDAEQQLEYQRGLSLERSGKLAQAHDQLLAAARRHPYPKGTLTDDAFWRASLVAERLGSAELAVADLREMLAMREIAHAGQSYERPKYPISQMRIAELYRDRLGDLRAAQREFRVLYRDHPDSSLCDDAVWQDGLMSLRLQDGDQACRAARRLAESHPASRYSSCVTALCPALEPPSSSRDCPAYLMAQLAPDAELPRSTVPEPQVEP